MKHRPYIRGIPFKLNPLLRPLRIRVYAPLRKQYEFMQWGDGYWAHRYIHAAENPDPDYKFSRSRRDARWADRFGFARGI